MDGPLDGVRVLEIGRYVSGPFAAKILGDMGAEVVKIEDPESGSPTRVSKLPYDTHGHESLTYRFLYYNTSKKSLAVDLKSPEGAAVFERLVETADVCIENMRPVAMAGLGFGWDELCDLNDSLVYCSIKGYGTEGPYARLPALDTLIQGMSGFATQVGNSGRPESTNVLLIDLLTGMYAATSVVMALYERTVSSDGQKVEVSMLDAAISMLGHQLSEYTGSVHNPGYDPTYGPVFAPNGYFRTADGYLGLFVPDDNYWRDFCAVLGRPEWANEESKYATTEQRLMRRSALIDDLEAIFTEQPTQGWLDEFADCDRTILAAPVNDVEGMIDDPQVRAQGAVESREDPDLGEFYMPAPVPKFSRTPGLAGDVPRLGDATDDLLYELGFSKTERDRMREADVIG